jgi:diguanylate cyclase (GGDEF)-like protein
VYALIAEFDPQRAAIYRKCVEALQLEAVVVRDGDAAKDVLQMREAPALLVSDLSLPKSDGFALIAALRRLSPPDRTAIVVYSAFAELRAAALSLRGTLGIAEVGEKNLSAELVRQGMIRALAGLGPTRPSDDRPDADDLISKIVYRISKAFRAPGVVISLEIRGQRRLVGGLNVHHMRRGAQPWPVLQQVAETWQPLVVPDVARHELWGLELHVPSLRIQGFAAVPLITSKQHFVGVMSLLDFKPLTLTAEGLDLLLDAAQKIADELVHELKDALAVTPLMEHAWSREERAALARLALTDPLTGLSNRHAGERALERDVARARRAGLPFSIALLDLDEFKQVNDRFGHAAGDDILRQVSRILTSTFRASDLAVRWGGDEFMVLLPDATGTGATIFAERARMQVEGMTAPSGKVTISAGVVEIKSDELPHDAIRRADAQLYAAKRAGRNRVIGP